MKTHPIDVKENAIQALDPKILTFLLKDKTTRNNIIWATDDYSALGNAYSFNQQITADAITGTNGTVIRPRIEKTKEAQTARSKCKAEVFTPSWVCNRQNNLVDTAWFERENVFNVETENGWITNKSPIEFPNTKGQTWQDYVKVNRLEISCGEAPYLVSRYDTVSGDPIPVKERIGLLDRKLRVVSENVHSEQKWVLWAKRAVQSVYGYDWQGDNVLLARENILYSFAEHYFEKFGVPVIKKYLIDIAKVVAWNIWQMDGIKFVVPNSCHPVVEDQYIINGFEEEQPLRECPGCTSGDHSKHNGVYCRIYDWSHNGSVEFYSFIKKGARNNGSKI